MNKKLIAVLLFIFIMMFGVSYAKLVDDDDGGGGSSTPTTCQGYTYGGYVDATCTNSGYYYCGCSYCSGLQVWQRTKGGTISAKGHNYGNWYKSSDTQHSKKCSRCGNISSENHSLGSYSDYSDSQHRAYCSVCKDYVYKSHTYDTYVKYNADQHRHKCTVCGHYEYQNHSYTEFTYKSTSICLGHCKVGNCDATKEFSHVKEPQHHHCSKCGKGYLGDKNAPNGSAPTGNDSCYFKSSNTCSQAGCGESISLTGIGALGQLDRLQDYKMWPDTHQHKNVESATVTLSHIPYKDESRTTQYEFELAFANYLHANWERHAMEFDRQWDYDSSDFLPSYQSELEETAKWVNQHLDSYHEMLQMCENLPYDQWPDDLKMAFIREGVTSNPEVIQKTGDRSINIYTAELYGHVIIGAVRAIGGGITLPINRLNVRNAEDVVEYTQVRYIYRDTRGRTIEGAPADVTVDRSHIQTVPYAMVSPNTTSLNNLGYRYVGYYFNHGSANYRGCDVDGITSTSSSGAVPLTRGVGAQNYIVYIFEKIPIVHVVYRDQYGREINFNGSIPDNYKLQQPSNLNGKNWGNPGIYNWQTTTENGYNINDGKVLDIRKYNRNTYRYLGEQNYVITASDAADKKYDFEYYKKLPNSVAEGVQDNWYNRKTEYHTDRPEPYTKDRKATNGSITVYPYQEGWIVYVFEVMPEIEFYFRDTAGNAIPGSSKDKVIDRYEEVHEYDGYEFKYTPEMEKLDPLGWRYVGHFWGPGHTPVAEYTLNYIKAFGTTDDKEVKSVSKGNSTGKITNYSKKLNQATCGEYPTKTIAHMTIIYEPVRLTVLHWDKDTSRNIITKKNVTFELPKVINMEGHTHTSLGETIGQFTGADETPGSKILSHNIDSLSKAMWPGYITYEYTLHALKTNNIHAVGSFNQTRESLNTDEFLKELTKTAYAVNERTRLQTPGEPEDINIDRKRIQLPVNIETGHDMGYRHDLQITFTYGQVFVDENHYILDSNPLTYLLGNVSDKIGFGKELKRKLMTAGSFTESWSLNLGEESYLSDDEGNKIYYNYPDYVVRKVELDAEVGQNERAKKEITIPAEDGIILKGVNAHDMGIVPQGNMTFNWYYENADIYSERHVIELTGTDLVLPKLIVKTDVTESSSRDLPGYEYIGYYRFFDKVKGGDEIGRGEGESVSIRKNIEKDIKQVVFYYKPVEQQIQSEEIAFGTSKVVLRANQGRFEEYENEEFDVTTVEKGVPTSEDLYANVITDTFLLKNLVKIQEKTQRIELKIVKQYYSDNDSNTTTIQQASDSVILNVPFRYYSGRDTVLSLIDYALVKNKVINTGDETAHEEEVRIPAKYDKEPVMQFKEGGNLVINNKGDSSSRGEKYDSPYAKGFYDVVNGTGSNGRSETKKATYIIDKVGYNFEAADEEVANYIKQISEDPWLVNSAIIEQGGSTFTTDKLDVYREDDSKVVIWNGGTLKVREKEYSLNELDPLVLNATPNSCLNKDVLYKNEDIYTYSKMANDTYETTADVYYVEAERINQETLVVEKIPEGERRSDLSNTKKDIKGNDVNIHTPVVNASYISATSKFVNQVINQQANKKYLQLDEKFEIFIPDNGTHKDAKGYQTRAFNSFQGFLSGSVGPGGRYTDWGEIKDVRLPFDVYLEKTSTENVFIPAGKWISEVLGNGYQSYLQTVNKKDKEGTTFRFLIPVWVEERAYEIETRVIAENAIGTYLDKEGNATTLNKKDKTQIDANLNRDNYVATHKIPVDVIGKIYDLQVQESTDPDWMGNVQSLGYTTGYVRANEFPFGRTRSQGTIRTSQNKNVAYQYAPKLGYTFVFNFKTKGRKSDNISISVSDKGFYYVSKVGNNNTAVAVDLYYKASDGNYKQIKTGNGNSNIQVALANKFMGVNPIEMTNSSRIYKNELDKVYNYSIKVSIGDIAKLSLPHDLRVTFDNIKEYITDGGNGLYKVNKTSMLANANTNKNSSTVYSKNYSKDTAEDFVVGSVGRWYAGYALPTTTVAVQKGLSPADADKAIKTNDTSKIKRDGFILVRFDIRSNSGTNPYLQYKGPEMLNDLGVEYNSNEKDQTPNKPYDRPTIDWTKTTPETTEIILPTGAKATVPADAIAIFETNYTATIDMNSVINN